MMRTFHALQAFWRTVYQALGLKPSGFLRLLKNRQWPLYWCEHVATTEQEREGPHIVRRGVVKREHDQKS